MHFSPCLYPLTVRISLVILNYYYYYYLLYNITIKLKLSSGFNNELWTYPLRPATTKALSNKSPANLLNLLQISSINLDSL